MDAIGKYCKGIGYLWKYFVKSVCDICPTTQEIGSRKRADFYSTADCALSTQHGHDPQLLPGNMKLEYGFVFPPLSLSFSHLYFYWDILQFLKLKSLGISNFFLLCFPCPISFQIPWNHFHILSYMHCFPGIWLECGY